MSVSYYKVLGVARDATMKEIRVAYKRHARMCHPDKSEDINAEDQFRLLQEAYETLSDAPKRAIYDAFGSVDAKHLWNILAQDEPVFQFHCSSEDILQTLLREVVSHSDLPTRPLRTPVNRLTTSTMYYEQCPNSDNPMNGLLYNDAFVDSVKTSAVYHNMLISLENCFTGCQKKMRITRRKFSTNSRDTSFYYEDCLLLIEVKPGCKAGTKFVFPQAGDQYPDVLAADIIFVACDMPNDIFKRVGNDLHHTATITLKEALCGATVSVPTLNRGIITLNIYNTVHLSTEKKIPDLGLPDSQFPDKYGSLIINFEIIFPDSLPLEIKAQLRALLPE